MEPRAVERFSETMADEEPEPQMLFPYALDRTRGFYVKVRNVEGLLCMLVFQSQPGEKSVCVADLLFTGTSSRKWRGSWGCRAYS